ncbi:N-acetylmuramoyl-L-alanine amidase [Mycolicibacterium sp.]|uniref:N-acetylmuramoyl-L-alanine amidase n=1 Tax=Mycolicibacterium sp. TaxID=2320850 RepID=UPI0037C5BA65
MTNDVYARQIIQAGKDLGITPRGIVIAFATVYVEANWLNYANSKVPESLTIPHDAVGSDGKSVGLFQQQVVWGNGAWWWGSAADCMDPYKSARLFFQRLATKPYQAATTDVAAGAIAQSIQGSAFPDRYAQRMAEAQRYYDRLAGGTVPDVDPNRPPYNEFPIWSENHYDGRSGVTIDAIFLHTSEGFVGRDDAAEALSLWYQPKSRQVAYHYAVSQASDGGVTVVDNVDTDDASWSVLSANNRSINLCFAGTQAAWSRNDWITKFGNAIDVAAYLAVQDCKKYGIPTNVIAPPYTGRIPGISDHRYVTKVLGDGTHTDLGDGFPWDVFTAAVKKYATGETATPQPEPKPVVVGPADDQLNMRFHCLGDRTLVEAVAVLLDKELGTNNAGKPGVVMQ